MRFFRDQLRRIDTPQPPPPLLQSVPIRSTITERSSCIGQGRARLEESMVELDARPFDIYVEFGLGARVMMLYGTAMARSVSAASPLTSNYRTHREMDRDVARERASMRN
jgi:hypothetical protein